MGGQWEGREKKHQGTHQNILSLWPAQKNEDPDMTYETFLDAIPDYAQDLKLNLTSLLKQPSYPSNKPGARSSPPPSAPPKRL